MFFFFLIKKNDSDKKPADEEKALKKMQLSLAQSEALLKARKAKVRKSHKSTRKRVFIPKFSSSFSSFLLLSFSSVKDEPGLEVRLRLRPFGKTSKHSPCLCSR